MKRDAAAAFVVFMLLMPPLPFAAAPACLSRSEMLHASDTQQGLCSPCSLYLVILCFESMYVFVRAAVHCLRMSRERAGLR